MYFAFFRFIPKKSCSLCECERESVLEFDCEQPPVKLRSTAVVDISIRTCAKLGKCFRNVIMSCCRFDRSKNGLTVVGCVRIHIDARLL